MFVTRTFLCVLAIAGLSIAIGGDAVAGSNQPTKPCGTFTTTGKGHAVGGARCTVNFSFSPTVASCGAEPCVCTQIAYVQVIRARDVDRNEYIQPFEEQEERMILGNPAPQLNGWAVDRSANNSWGYFGGINGTPITFDTGKVEPGDNGASPKKRAMMKDRPERWKKRVEFEAVSVPVCIDATSACANRLLGFRAWNFKVRDNGTGTDPVSRTATEWEREAVMLALDRWNDEASSTMQLFSLQPLN